MCERYLPVARVYFRRHVGGTDGDELAQEALLTLIEAVREERLRKDDRVGGFLFGVCRNLVARRGRSESRRRRALAQIVPESVTEPADGRVDLDNLARCFGLLTGRAREVVTRVFVRDEAPSTIAAELQMTPGNVRVVLHRALRTLHDGMVEGTRS